MTADQTASAVAMMIFVAFAIAVIALVPLLDWHLRQRVARSPANDNRPPEVS